MYFSTKAVKSHDVLQVPRGKSDNYYNIIAKNAKKRKYSFIEIDVDRKARGKPRALRSTSISMNEYFLPLDSSS